MRQSICCCFVLIVCLVVGTQCLTTPHHYDVVIVGGSIAGLATAAGLPDRKVCVLEKANQFRQVGALIALFPNGVTALERISSSLKEMTLRNCVKLESTQLWNLENTLVKETRAAQHSNSRFLLWYELQESLFNELSSNTTVKLACTYREAKDQGDHVRIDFTDGSSTSTITCDVLVGADGIHSSVRSEVGCEEPLRFHSRTIFRGILPVEAASPPAGVARTYRGDGDGKFFKLWNANGKLTFTSALSTTRQHDLTDVDENTKLLQQTFRKYPIDFSRISPEKIYTNHVSDRDLPDWKDWTRGRIILIGDAAHSMVPALGQGGNMALEDACELSGLLQAALSNPEADVVRSLEEFARQRHSRIQAIHQASREQTRNKRNKNQAPLDEFMARNPSFYQDLYGWNPVYRPQ